MVSKVENCDNSLHRGRDRLGKVECIGCKHFRHVKGTSLGKCLVSESSATSKCYFDAYNPWICPYGEYSPV
jgi:hypothetical protein